MGQMGYRKRVNDDKNTTDGLLDELNPASRRRERKTEKTKPKRSDVMK